MSSIPPHIFIGFDSSGYFPPDECEKEASKKLRELIDRYDIVCNVAEAVEEEAKLAPDSVQQIVNGSIISYDMATTVQERQEILQIRQLLFGATEDLSQGQVNDARILFNAKKYGCTYLVTFDKNHILSKSDEIKEKLGFEVIAPSECLKILLDFVL